MRVQNAIISEILHFQLITEVKLEKGLFRVVEFPHLSLIEVDDSGFVGCSAVLYQEIDIPIELNKTTQF
jgi:hypothetical protein